MKKKMWKFSNLSTADSSLASSHWLRPELDASGCCLFSDHLILIVLTFLYYADILVKNTLRSCETSWDAYLFELFIDILEF